MDKAAASYLFFKEDVRDWIYKNFDEKSFILDVGAGNGMYKDFLGDKYVNVDAVEIYYPNIIDYKLLEKYRSVANRDIVGYEYKFYDLIIFGDVIEHLTVEDAQRVINYAYYRCKNMIVAVPYKYHQEANENKWEEHKQDDLTHEIFMWRYPGFEPLFKDELYGYYVKKGKA